MKVFIDSSTLFSAAYAKGSVPYLAFAKAVEPPYHGLICEQNLEEIRRAFKRKLPEKTEALEQFITAALSVVEIVPIPPSRHPDKGRIRDIDDRPILRAAIEAGADIIVTGDKDFLESGLDSPKRMTAADFIQQL